MQTTLATCASAPSGRPLGRPSVRCRPCFSWSDRTSKPTLTAVTPSTALTALVDAGLEMAFDRAAGGRQRDRDVHGPLLGDVDGADHPELHDVAVQLGVDDDLQRLEDLISRGHAAHCRRRGSGGRERTPARRAGRAAASIAQRRAAQPLRLEPERRRDLASADAVGEHAEDRQVGRRRAARRPPAARAASSARRAAAVAQRVEQRARRRRPWAARASAPAIAARTASAGVGERGVDDHPRRRRAARGCAGTARGRRRRAGGGRPARPRAAVSAIASKPSRAVAAVAATRRPSSSSSSPRRPARTAGWSSTSTMSITGQSRDARRPRPSGATPNSAGCSPYGSTSPRRIA